MCLSSAMYSFQLAPCLNTLSSQTLLQANSRFHSAAASLQQLNGFNNETFLPAEVTQAQKRCNETPHQCCGDPRGMGGSLDPVKLHYPPPTENNASNMLSLRKPQWYHGSDQENPPNYVERDIAWRSFRQGRQCGETFPHSHSSAHTGALFTDGTTQEAGKLKRNWSIGPMSKMR